MLVELHVRQLGVIEEATVALGPGMTALTGETGAGKTLLVEALELLLGGRADALLVRPGAEEALVEARFVGGDGEEEITVARAVPAEGRSRAWVDGRMAPASALAERGSGLVDLHGQHAQQSLLDPGAQRRALDVFGGIDTSRLASLRDRRRSLRADLAGLGGDTGGREREAELLRHALAEIGAASLQGPDEDVELAEEEDRLAEAAGYREAAAGALAALDAGEAPGGAGAVDRLGEAASLLGGRPALSTLAGRLTTLQTEAADVASELRAVLETWEDDPARLAEVRARRQLLRDLARKYAAPASSGRGGPDVDGVAAYEATARRRLEEIESAGDRAGALERDLAAVTAEMEAEQAVVGAARRAAAPELARAVESRLRQLAMPRARLEVQVGAEDPGDDVSILLGANPGEPVLPLAKVASGGELARAMLALRLVLSEAPPTMVFDEVDAGVGGEAALSVGRALAELAARHQVLVVTHLPQVAAFATRQLVVRKDERGGRTAATVEAVEGEDRVVELARMLSGRPGSATARRHAEELLGTAGAGGRSGPQRATGSLGR